MPLQATDVESARMDYRLASKPIARAEEDDPSLASLVRQVPICVAGSRAWFGEIGPTLLYRARRVSPERVRVGYFVYFATERPFGDNLQTQALLPAIAIDAVYSHLLFVLPGLQRVVYGAADIEGVSITYRIDERGALRPVEIIADNTAHALVSLDVRDAIDEHGRIVLLDDAWSHQLGGLRATSALRQGTDCRCFQKDEIKPLSPTVTSQFRLGSPSHPRRAAPAWL